MSLLTLLFMSCTLEMVFIQKFLLRQKELDEQKLNSAEYATEFNNGLHK